VVATAVVAEATAAAGEVTEVAVEVISAVEVEDTSVADIPAAGSVVAMREAVSVVVVRRPTCRVDHSAAAAWAGLGREAWVARAWEEWHLAEAWEPADSVVAPELPVHYAPEARGECGLRSRRDRAVSERVVAGALSSPVTRVWEAASAAAE
jgi:hypothetical protein